MTEFIQLLFNGSVNGALFALIALGITLIYGLSGLVNFAHGQTLVLGAYVTFSLSEAGVGYAPALIGASLLCGAVGVAMEQGLFKWTYARPIVGFIVSLGLIAVIELVVVEVWGTDTKVLLPPLRDTIKVGGLVFPSQRVLILGISLISIAALFVFLQATKTGRAIRAAAEDRETAQLLGIEVSKLTTLIFFLGSALAGLAGGLIATLGTLTPFLGLELVFIGFAVTLIGGLGSVAGAAVIGMMLGILQSFMGGYVEAGWSDSYPFLVMILIIMIRPRGLFRGTEGASIH